MEQLRYLIVYHANCIDGFTACWAIRKHLLEVKHANESDIEYFSGDYSLENKTTMENKIKHASPEYDKVFIVDYSISKEQMQRIVDWTQITEVIMLDHHKTAFEEWCPDMEIAPDSCVDIVEDGYNVYLNNAKSGAGIAWDYPNLDLPGKTKTELCVPWLIKYVQDYDIWKWKYGQDTAYINKVLSNTVKVFDNWEALYEDLDNDIDRQRILNRGRILQEQFDSNVTAICSMAIPAVIRNQQGLFTVASREYSSAVGNRLAQKSGTFGSTVVFNKEKREINFSLRSEGDYDVSQLAKFFGGGGHKNAAGFMLTEEGYIEHIEKGDINFGPQFLSHFKYKEE